MGSNLVLYLKKLHLYDVYSAYYKHGYLSPFDIYLDITNYCSVLDTLTQIKPEVVIHAAAITNSNYCATHKELAWNVNVLGTQNIVKAIFEVGSRLIFISTDQVYSGYKPFSKEYDDPSPICFYGNTKLEAERIVALGCYNYCIARTSLIYGVSNTCQKSFFDVFVDNLINNRPTRLFYDEYRSPIFLDNYCEIILELISRSDVRGLYNISGDERVSRYELGWHVASSLTKDKALLIPVSINDYKFEDGRPQDCSMCNREITKILCRTLVGIQEASAIIKCQIAQAA